jgi:hypothetical protein
MMAGARGYPDAYGPFRAAPWSSFQVERPDISRPAVPRR